MAENREVVIVGAKLEEDVFWPYRWSKTLGAVSNE